ncbi:MAG: GNAT family N-acetyltransferase [Chloroflexi bacterium]|nr:GNAT family N-acetyltransferase [Chloroflexota bacterium]
MNSSILPSELNATDFHCTAPLFASMAHHLAVTSILSGRTPARIFVDDPTRPKAALAWAGHRFHLAGSPDNCEFNAALACLFTEEVVAHHHAAGASVFIVCYEPAGWSSPIETTILRDLQPEQYGRRYYALPAETAPADNWKALLPAGYNLQAVDAALLAQSHLLHLDSLKSEMCSERPSVQDFLDKSFGVCIVHGDELAGWCLSEYNCSNRCEIGIETIEKYQRRSLATLMTYALVETGRAKGVTEFGWHCWAGNVPSAATALKAGFRHVCDYPAYFT